MLYLAFQTQADLTAPLRQFAAGLAPALTSLAWSSHEQNYLLRGMAAAAEMIGRGASPMRGRPSASRRCAAATARWR